MLTGSTRPGAVERFPYRPTRVLESIADVVSLVKRVRTHRSISKRTLELPHKINE